MPSVTNPTTLRVVGFPTRSVPGEMCEMHGGLLPLHLVEVMRDLVLHYLRISKMNDIGRCGGSSLLLGHRTILACITVQLSQHKHAREGEGLWNTAAAL